MSDTNRQRTSVERVLGGSPLGVFVRLIITSFIVGLILRALDVSPGDILFWLENRLRSLSNLGFDTVEQFGAILILGAVVVVPIWLIVRALKLFGR
ncbi:MAG: DUF6460 domain-containing protein [Pseudomonadota bacterium]